MGSDFAGVVRAVGPGVTQFKPGDEVFGIARLKESGAYAEAVITRESHLALKPAELFRVDEFVGRAWQAADP